MRYHTQLYSTAIYSLVPGKENWRLVGAVAFANSVGSVARLARAATLVRRFLGPGEPHPALFDSIIGVPHDEPYLSLNLMDMLGYVGVVPNSKEEAENLLDQAIRASHL